MLKSKCAHRSSELPANACQHLNVTCCPTEAAPLLDQPSGKVDLLPVDVQLRILEALSLLNFPAVARTCKIWRDLSGDAFSVWLRWHSAEVVLESLVPSADHGDRPRIVPNVCRSGGCLEFVNSDLWVQRAIPACQAVKMVQLSFSCSGEVSQQIEHPTRHWPYEAIVGGLPGGMVAHSHDAMAFFPSTEKATVARVPKQYQNVLHAGDQVFLLSKTSPNVYADVLNLVTGQKVRCNLDAFFQALKKQNIRGRNLVRSAVSATDSHFIMHQSTQDGEKIVAALRLPNAAQLPNDDQKAVVAFARRWPSNHPISQVTNPEEFPAGDCLVLHGGSCQLPISILHAATGDVDVVRLSACPPLVDTSDSFRTAAMNPARTLFFAVCHETATLCIWHTSGPLLRAIHFDVHSVPRQLAVHPTLPLVAIDMQEDSQRSEARMHALLVRLSC